MGRICIGIDDDDRILAAGRRPGEDFGKRIDGSELENGPVDYIAALHVDADVDFWTLLQLLRIGFGQRDLKLGDAVTLWSPSEKSG